VKCIEPIERAYIPNLTPLRAGVRVRVQGLGLRFRARNNFDHLLLAKKSNQYPFLINMALNIPA